MAWWYGRRIEKMMAMPIVTGIDVAKAEYTEAAWS